MGRLLRHPIRSVKEPFGIAGLVVAVFALILALGGTALAVAGFTKAQEKQIAKIAKKYAGQPGASGSTGANGTNGTNGSNGTNGVSTETNTFAGNEHGCPDGGIEVKSGGPVKYVCNGSKGTNGTSVEVTPFTGEKTVGSVTCKEGGTEVKSAKSPTALCNGKEGSPWTAGGTLPSGAEETGVWTYNQVPTKEFIEGRVPISFSIPLASDGTSAFYFSSEALEEGFFGQNSTTHQPCEVGEPECVDTGCRWSVFEPESRPESRAAGTLCVFAQSEAVFPEVLEGTLIQDPTREIAPGFGPSGAYLRLEKKATATADGVFLSGTWAVKAP